MHLLLRCVIVWAFCVDFYTLKKHTTGSTPIFIYAERGNRCSPIRTQKANKTLRLMFSRTCWLLKNDTGLQFLCTDKTTKLRRTYLSKPPHWPRAPRARKLTKQANSGKTRQRASAIPFTRSRVYPVWVNIATERSLQQTKESKYQKHDLWFSTFCFNNTWKCVCVGVCSGCLQQSKSNKRTNWYMWCREPFLVQCFVFFVFCFAFA